MKENKWKLCFRLNNEYTIFVEKDKVKYYGENWSGSPDKIIKRIESEYAVASRQAEELKEILVAYKKMLKISDELSKFEM